ncbi:MAG: hypothetical protein V2I56_16395 [Desulfobacteraceae bacterium]|jgi:hypothetical protein|nr:hypothetical protein [Desulfobacteraceae bacterium]
MKINNIERNIIYLLGRKWIESKTPGPFDTDWIFDKFSDIPDRNMKEALQSLKEDGYVELTSNYRRISLTRKGLSKIKVIKLPKNGKFPVPKEL